MGYDNNVAGAGLDTAIDHHQVAVLNSMLTQAIATEENLDSQLPADDLLLLEGMQPDLALALARRGVRTREDLAEQAVDDLLDIQGLTAEEAGQLIMKAREHWFAAGHG